MTKINTDLKVNQAWYVKLSHSDKKVSKIMLTDVTELTVEFFEYEFPTRKPSRWLIKDIEFIEKVNR